ncbi:uncharacterized protein J4E88_008730 [Alternaria novae-zelandiae]|uniref:uncharacterized protein n=1 Tax=Alternaria novae-zelandiae TaxID=430562 RepID=UPI0020C33B82|nr:uncharacterized protein J4E88_008730 [Alternaria novae-zelandiae]KAI4673674.1 hypothetical protein J4E88_008730 [Alternaria novae-zelandiae]
MASSNSWSGDDWNEWKALNAELEASYESHSKAWNKLYYARMHDRLPREIRDMINAEFWDEDYLTGGEGYKVAMKVRDEPTLGYISLPHRILPISHVVLPGYVGDAAAKENVQMWYEAYGTMACYRDWLAVGSRNIGEELTRAICKDIFGVGLDPATALRKLTIEVSDTSLVLGHEQSDFKDATSREDAFNLLLRIKKKRGFKLEIIVLHDCIRLKMWPEILGLLQPIVKLSTAWNMLCSARMQERLPVEIREMIYAQIWNVKYLKSVRQPRQQSGPLDHSDPRCHTHVVRPDFMGKETALEMARAWYEAAATLTPDTFTIPDNRESIKRTVCEDCFQVGLDPATVLRTLTIDFDETTSRLASPYCKWPDADTRRNSFDLLHLIKKKAGFRLNFRICTPKFRLNCWPDFFDLLQPIVKTLENEGAIVDVQAIHCSQGLHPTPYVFVDLNSILRSHDPVNWKQGIIEYLDSICDCRIRNQDRHYRGEDEPDYNPDDGQEDYWNWDLLEDKGLRPSDFDRGLSRQNCGCDGSGRRRSFKSGFIKRKDLDAQKEVNSVKDEIVATNAKLDALQKQRKEMTKKKIDALLRAYRIENNDDYDPTSRLEDGDTPYGTDEDIYSDEGDSDDSVERYRHDGRGNYPGAVSSPRQYGSDLIQWKNDLLEDLEMEESEAIKDMYEYWESFDAPSWVGASSESEHNSYSYANYLSIEKADQSIKNRRSKSATACPKHGQIPYFMRPGFVGDASALEIVEFWYKSISRVKPDMWELRTTDELDYVIRGDAFSVGLDTTTVVRKLTLRLTTDGFLRNKGKDTSESKRTVDALLQIKNKANFKLRLRLEQSYLQLNPWFTVFDIFRPMIEKFEEEGADVRLLLVYAQDLKPKLVFNMLPALKNPESNWREEAARHFDSDSRVREHHKHYRIENDADYDPRELKSRDYSEDDWESDDYLGYEETDSDRDEDGKSISPEPPWTPYEPPRYYGTMFREDQIEEGYELDSASEGDD